MSVLPFFFCSANWLRTFKKKFWVGGKKITKLVSKETTDFKQITERFVTVVKILIKYLHITHDQIFNSDLPTFSKENTCRENTPLFVWKMH